MPDSTSASRSAPSPELMPRQVNDVRPQTWADPGTWSASVKFLPAYIALVAIFIAIYFNHFMNGGLDVNDYESCRAGFNYTFHINAASSQAQSASQNAVEAAWTFEAIQQLFNPQRSVFGSDPFPKGKIPSLGVRLDEASIYFDKKMRTTRNVLLAEENLVNSSSTALGTAAVMFGQKWTGGHFLTAATRLKDSLFKAPMYYGAIRHRFDEPQLQAQAAGLFAPFLAYYGIANDDLELVKEAARQVQAYRDQLVIGTGKTKGLWRHAVGEASKDDIGAWSTGNAVAAYGMAKLRSTIVAWPQSNATMSKEVDNLDFWIQEILDAAIETDNDESGLLRNYLGDDTSAGETSGTSLLAATAYRMAKIRPDLFEQARYLDWADRKRHAVFKRVDDHGVIRPATDPNDPQSKTPVDISAEGESFLMLLGTAWRDVICGGQNQAILDGYFAESHTSPPAPPMTFESVVGYTPGQIFESYRQHLRRIYGMLWKSIKGTFETLTGYSVDALYAQAMEPVQRYADYFSGPS